MSSRIYTLKEVAALLCATGDQADMERVARQIRHWTLADLLTPAGKKYTGTGVSRRYSELEVRKAAILREVSRYGLTVTQLDGFGDWIEGVSSMAKWRDAIDGKRPVYLELMWSEDGDSLWMIGADAPRVFQSGPKFVRTSTATLTGGKQIEMPEPEFTSAIVINLSKIMERLKL